MSGSNPKIGFFANGTELFSLRFRYDADPINRQKTAYRPRFRFYVENGKYLDKLGSNRMKTFTTFLTEQKNLHLEHLEDELFNRGDAGVKGSDQLYHCTD